MHGLGDEAQRRLRVVHDEDLLLARKRLEMLIEARLEISP
jgi:hypothetical protein